MEFPARYTVVIGAQIGCLPQSQNMAFAHIEFGMHPRPTRNRVSNCNSSLFIAVVGIFFKVETAKSASNCLKTVFNSYIPSFGNWIAGRNKSPIRSPSGDLRRV
jgi:hypothetical protein